ncbi:MAG: hypothetical protein ABI345_09260 [Jatrophihabitans sp.]
MTPRNRSHDLTADLLDELQAEETAARPAAPAPGLSTRVDAEAAPHVQAALYLTPRAWRRLTLARTGRSVSMSVGPLRLRIGRDSS